MANAGRSEGSPGVLIFTYHHAVAPMMWVLFGLVCIEAIVTHALIAMWNVHVALALSLLSGATAAWVVMLIRSLSRMPVLLNQSELLWPAGALRAVRAPLVGIRGRVADWTLDDLRRAGLFNAALIAHPNIVLALDPPIRRGRHCWHYLAHRLDDPEAFNSALDGLLADHDRIHR